MLTDHPWLAFVVCLLAVWRIAHLLVLEDGPFHGVVRLRAALGDSQLGQAMDCFYCASLWIAIPFAVALASDIAEGVALWLALSGGASLLWSFSDKTRQETI